LPIHHLEAGIVDTLETIPGVLCYDFDSDPPWLAVRNLV
jgi:hypothetical protein